MTAGITPSLLQQRLCEFPPPRCSTCAGGRRATRPLRFAAPYGAQRKTSANGCTASSRGARRRLLRARPRDVAGRRRVCCAAPGYRARNLDGGLDGWQAQGGAIAPLAPPTHWVTRERPKIDRIACPWLDPALPRSGRRILLRAECGRARICRIARRNGLRHSGRRVLARGSAMQLRRVHSHSRTRTIPRSRISPPSCAVRTPVNSALAPQAPGLLAISLGLSAMIADDHAMLRWGMLIYDTLYTWCRAAVGETHGWHPALLRT